jgi:hypothetical protein
MCHEETEKDIKGKEKLRISDDFAPRDDWGSAVFRHNLMQLRRCHPHARQQRRRQPPSRFFRGGRRFFRGGSRRFFFWRQHHVEECRELGVVVDVHRDQQDRAAVIEQFRRGACRNAIDIQSKFPKIFISRACLDKLDDRFASVNGNATTKGVSAHLRGLGAARILRPNLCPLRTRRVAFGLCVPSASAQRSVRRRLEGSVGNRLSF